MITMGKNKRDMMNIYTKNIFKILLRKCLKNIIWKIGTKKQPKMSLSNVYKEIIIPAIEEKIVNRYNEKCANRGAIIHV